MRPLRVEPVGDLLDHINSLSLAFVSAAPAAPREVLPWVDDYSKAVAQARAKNVPIFVEAWAPW